MLQNGVGWMTSRSILGTRRLAVRSRAGQSPITPPIIPRSKIAPIIPVGPTPAARARAPVAPPIAPGELEFSVFRSRRLAIAFSNIRDRLANGAEPLGDTRPACGRRVGAYRMPGSRAWHRRAEQQRNASGPGRYDLGQDSEVFVLQQHASHASSTRALLYQGAIGTVKRRTVSRKNPINLGADIIKSYVAIARLPRECARPIPEWIDWVLTPPRLNPAAENLGRRAAGDGYPARDRAAPRRLRLRAA